MTLRCKYEIEVLKDTWDYGFKEEQFKPLYEKVTELIQRRSPILVVHCAEFFLATLAAWLQVLQYQSDMYQSEVSAKSDGQIASSLWLTAWDPSKGCSNTLLPYLSETEEVIVDRRRSRKTEHPLLKNREAVEHDLTWSLNTSHLVKKAQQRLFFLSKLKQRARRIAADPTHPGNGLFILLCFEQQYRRQLLPQSSEIISILWVLHIFILHICTRG